MDRYTIRRIAPIVIILAVLLTWGTITAYAINPKSEDIVEHTLQEIGVEDGTINGFYLWALSQITSGLTDMDEAVESATGKEHNLADLFTTSISDSFDYFADVESDEEALAKLDQLINQIAG